MSKKVVWVGICGSMVVAAWAAWPRSEALSERGTRQPEAGHRNRAAIPPPRPSRPVALGRAVVVGDAPVDLTETIERTHFAFVPAGDRFVGGDAAYAVAVSGSRIEISPERTAPDVRGAALALHTSSFGREGAVARTTGAFERDADGHLVAPLGTDAAEHLRNTRIGAEQSWELERAPEGTGDLMVRIATAGQTFVGTSRGGLHFTDPATGLGMRYGHATWVEADGERHEIVATIDGTDITLRVPETVVENADYPVVLDPTISAEYAMDAPIYGPAPDVQNFASVGHSGANGNEFLVVWHDRRRSVGLNYDIYAAHVNHNGNVVDPVGFLVTDPNDGVDHKYPHAVWDGYQSAYAIIFASGGHIKLRVLPSASSTTPASPEIQVDNPPALPCSACGGAPDLAWNQYQTPGSDRFLAAWTDGTAIRGLSFRLTQTGGVWSFVTSISVAPQSNASGSPPYLSGSNAAAGASNFLETWDDGSGSIRGRIIDGAGNPVWSGVVTGPISGQPVSDGRSGQISPDSWLVVSKFYTSQWGWQVAGTQIGTNGTLYNTIQIATASGSQVYPMVVGSDAYQAFVAWQDWPASGPITVRGSRVATNAMHDLGSLDPFEGLPIGGVANFSDISGHYDENFQQYLLTWGDQRVDAIDNIYGARVSSAGVVLDPGGFLISKSANRETAPAIASCGKRYLVAWSDTRNGSANPDIYGSLLNGDGTVAVQNVAITTASGRQDLPAIACNGTNFYVVWVDERNGTKDIRGNAIDATTGARLIAHDVLISTGSTDTPSIAFGAGQYEVVYSYSVNAQVRAARVNATTGLLIDADKPISGGPDIQDKFPDVDFDGTNFLVVVRRATGTSGEIVDIVGTLVDTTNSIVGATFSIENAAGEQRYPRVRWEGIDSYIVIYEDDRNIATTGTDIYARRVKTTGSVLAAFPVAAATDNEYAPRLARRAASTLEATYQRGPSATVFDYGVWGQSLLNGATSGAAFAISSGSGIREITPAISCAAATRCVVPYRWFNPTDTQTGVDRIKARALTY